MPPIIYSVYLAMRPRIAKSRSRTSTAEWLVFWEGVSRPDRVGTALGFFFLIMAGLGLGFIGSKSLEYSRSFYNIVFTFDFLEDIRPGTKIRYQGGLAIGQVDYIEPGQKIHRVHARIKKDFHIPKMGSMATVSTWGYFGGKFINIEILNPDFMDDPYLPGNEMSVEKQVNSTVIFQKYYDLIRKDGDKNSILEEKLLGIRAIARDIQKNPALQPKNVREIVKKTTGSVNAGFTAINNAGTQSYALMEKINQISESMVYDVKKDLPRLKTAVEKFQKNVEYEGSSFLSGLLHEETAYYNMLDLSALARDKTAEWKREPYRMLFQ